MLDIPNRVALINRLQAIVVAANKTDVQKADELDSVFAELRNDQMISMEDHVYITQTRDGINGSRDSLLHTAIQHELPLTFNGLYTWSGGPSAISKRHRQAFHGPNNFVIAMSDKPIFSAKDPADPDNLGYGPGIGRERGERVSLYDVLSNNAFTWLDCFQFETRHETDVLMLNAKMALADRLKANGIRLPADTPLDYETVSDARTGEVTFICRSREMPNI